MVWGLGLALGLERLVWALGLGLARLPLNMGPTCICPLGLAHLPLGLNRPFAAFRWVPSDPDPAFAQGCAASVDSPTAVLSPPANA